MGRWRLRLLSAAAHVRHSVVWLMFRSVRWNSPAAEIS
jgi:hypothetical protein